MTYIYLGNLLKINYGFTAAQVIEQNLIVSFVYMIAVSLITYLISKRVYPLIIAKWICGIFSMLVLATPYVLENAQSSFDILLLQCCLAFFAMGGVAAKVVFVPYFPIFQRFTYTALIIAMAHAIMYIVTTFLLSYLVNYYGYKAIYSILIFCFGYYVAVKYFEKLEKEAGEI